MAGTSNHVAIQAIVLPPWRKVPLNTVLTRLPSTVKLTLTNREHRVCTGMRRTPNTCKSLVTIIMLQHGVEDATEGRNCISSSLGREHMIDDGAGCGVIGHIGRAGMWRANQTSSVRHFTAPDEMRTQNSDSRGLSYMLLIAYQHNQATENKHLEHLSCIGRRSSYDWAPK